MGELQMKKSYRLCLMAVLALTATGCSTLLKKNVASVRSSIGDIYQDQTLDNLARLIDDPEAVPSLSDLGNGSVESDLAFNPSVTIPFGNQVVTTVVGNPGQTITAPSRAFTLGGSIGNKLILGVAPVSDPFRLRNAAAVYRYVLGDESKDELRNDYQFPIKVASNGNMQLDPNYLLLPQCILCVKGNTLPASLDQSNAQRLRNADQSDLNPDLGKNGWVHSDLQADDHKLGVYGNHGLSISKDGYDNHRLLKLILLLLPEAPPSSTKSNG
jgi:hypothetical protein